MDDLLEQYREMFDDQFPLMIMRGKSEKEIEGIIKQCIKDGKPFEYDDELTY